MDCIRCGRDAGYNRAVLDVVSGRELGGFCRNCEYEEFGNALDRFCQNSDSCAMCERDGLVGFPAFRSSVEGTGDRLETSAGYEVTDRTPCLCDEHYHAVADGTSETVSGGVHG